MAIWGVLCGGGLLGGVPPPPPPLAGPGTGSYARVWAILRGKNHQTLGVAPPYRPLVIHTPVFRELRFYRTARGSGAGTMGVAAGGGQLPGWETNRRQLTYDMVRF